MHLTLVVGPATVHASVWDQARPIATTRVQLRTMGVRVTPLTSATILTSLESALTQLTSTVDLASIRTVNGAAYPALVGATAPDHHLLRDAFSPLARDGVPLHKWIDAVLRGPPGSGEESLGEAAMTAAHWRAGWDLDCAVLPFFPLSIAAALSTAPGHGDMVLLHDDLDMLVLPSPDILGASVVQDPNGRIGRMLLRDKYANGRWSVLAHLALLFAPGGSIGVDNKRFAFVRPFSPKAGTVRFEHGASVDEFYDLRANTRCVLEGQVLTYKQAAGTHFPARIILLTDEDNPAVPHLLAGVFDCPVFTPVSPTTSTPASAAGYGCALLAAAGDMAGVRSLLASQHAPDFGVHNPRCTHGKSSTLPTPPTMSRTTSLLHLALTPHSPPNRIQPPPSPAASDKGDDVEPWLRELERAPADKWECTIYAAMMPEFARIRALVDSGVIHPGTF